MSGLKIVKRYANRKLYDTERSCYVTLEDISVMIRGGEEVKVVDNKTGEDLTTVTLAQIIFEAEKKKNFMPILLLRGLIQDSATTLSKFAESGKGEVQAVAENIKEGAKSVTAALTDKLDGVLSQGDENTAPGKTLVNELIAVARSAFEELQKNVDEKIEGPVGGMARYASLGRDMEEVRRRLVDLETRLEKFPE